MGLVASVALGMPAAAQSPSAPPSPSAAPSPSAPPPAVNPYAATGAVPGSGAGLRIGTIGGDGDALALELIGDGIEEEAAIAGVVLVRCDRGDTSPDPVTCARQLR